MAAATGVTWLRTTVWSLIYSSTTAMPYATAIMPRGTCRVSWGASHPVSSAQTP